MILRKSKTPRKSPEKWTFLSLAFYNAPSLQTVDHLHWEFNKNRIPFPKFFGWAGGTFSGGLSPKPSFFSVLKVNPLQKKKTGPKNRSKSECTKIAHRRSLAIFTADEGIAGNSAARTIFTHFLRRRNRGSLAVFFAEEIAHLGASKNRAIIGGAAEIAAAAAENRAILVHSDQNRSTPHWLLGKGRD